MTPELALQLKTLPELPGIYQFLNKDGVVIYVGKAKNIKKRVNSYFTKQHDNYKTSVLVKKIVQIHHIVVANESEALLLENNFIKSLQPRYNILLKDDKTYPWICIKKEAFPRVFYTRKLIKDGSEYYGPYTNGKMVQMLLDLIKNLYPLRTCQLDLSEKKRATNSYKVCLEYHIGNCKGACENLDTEENYNQAIVAIREILKGNFKNSIKKFNEKMLACAENLDFENAQRFKEKLDLLNNYRVKSTVFNPKLKNLDCFSIVSDESFAYVNYIQVENGAIIRSHNLEIKKKLNESDEDVLSLAVIAIIDRLQLQPKEILLPFPLVITQQTKITVPQVGDKKLILDFSERNARYFRLDQLKQIQIVDPDRHTNRLMAQMKKDLRLNEEPRHIECFDNSNIQGTNPVAACVVFKDGKPSKADYRHFNIKTVEGPDDFASMEEVIFRRYKRLLDEKQPLPQLIIIDGGKGQLSSALKSIDALNLRGIIAIVGIAKRLEELFYPGDSHPMYLDKKSETLKVIQHLRNEAHRFGITHHRDKRSKSAVSNSLESIPGIGEKTMEKLIKHFKSVKRLKEAPLEAIIPVIGVAKANIISDFYKN